MQLELHQLDRRWEHLRARHAGQQAPIVVIATDQPDRYVVIDGYKRIAALQQLGRDTVEAVVWQMGEAEALLLDRSLRLTQQKNLALREQIDRDSMFEDIVGSSDVL